MTFFYRLTICLLLIAGISPAWAQSVVGYGEWQLHLPANRALALADAGARVYVNTENSLFYYDKALNTTQLLSQRDGLSDVGVTALGYDSVSRQTVLAYKSGNLDIVQANGTVRNLSDIARKSIAGTKRINHISFAGRRAYLSSTFGLVVLDLAKLEILDAYTNIGPAGATVTVYASAVANGVLYTATSVGLLRGSLSANLLDYRNWTSANPAGGPADRYRMMTVQAGVVYVGADGAGLYRYVNGDWRLVNGTYVGQFSNLRPSPAGLLVLDAARGVQRLDPVTDQLVLQAGTAQIGRPNDVSRQRDGSLYVASADMGLLRLPLSSSQAPEQFVLNAPESALAFSLLADARTNTVDIFSGGYSDRYVQQGFRQGFYEYRDGRWTNFTSKTLPDTSQYPNLLDPVRGTRTPDGTLYVASYGQGVLEWKGPGQYRRFTVGRPGNSPLRSAISNPDFTRVTDVTTDNEGNVWVVNRHQNSQTSGLFIFTPATDSWQTIPYFVGSENLDRVVVDDYGVAWVSAARAPQARGLVAVGRDGNARYLTAQDGLPDIEIYDLVKDRDGDIWAATLKGVAVFKDPSQVLLPSGTFQTPTVVRGEGTGFPALFGEAVRCVAVDGGNRKWLGTDRGLWLFNAKADESLLHFTTDNSPLPSNRIVDVAVNDKTGEVFIATDAGVVSYRGSASVTEGKPACSAVFPNPVRPEFNGLVGIAGVANNSYVKITDVSGKLVYATRANGGTVTWNMTDPNGQRVRSGVYLVLTSDADGGNTCVSKVAVLSK